MFEEREHKRWLRHIVFYVFVASLTIIVVSMVAIAFRAKLEEPERCGYSACESVVFNKDSAKAQLLSCRCQCESAQLLTAECAEVYECVRIEACWRLNKK